MNLILELSRSLLNHCYLGSIRTFSVDKSIPEERSLYKPEHSLEA